MDKKKFFAFVAVISILIAGAFTYSLCFRGNTSKSERGVKKPAQESETPTRFLGKQLEGTRSGRISAVNFSADGKLPLAARLTGIEFFNANSLWEVGALEENVELCNASNFSRNEGLLASYVKIVLLPYKKIFYH